MKHATVKSGDNPRDTRVEVDGVPVHGLRSVRFTHDADDIAVVEMELFSAEIDVKGIARIYACDPATGVAKVVDRIVFEDGSEWVA